MQHNLVNRNSVHLTAITLATLAIYALTMPRTISLEDAGLFQMVCHLGGISHPPGYPLFTSLCQIIVPYFSPGVIAGNLLSAVFASLACAVFFSCIRKLTGDLLTAYVAALSYGFSATFWSQAIIVEVYTLAVLAFVICWRVLLAYVGSGDVRYLYVTALIYGLSLTNHWPLMILATPALCLILTPRFVDIVQLLKDFKAWLIVISLFCLGLAPYLTILLQQNATIALLGDINTVDGLAQYIARSAYSDHHLAADSVDQFRYMGWLVRESAAQFGLIGIPLIILGAVIGARTLPKSVTVMLVLMYLSGTFLLNQLLNFSFEFLWQAVYKPYPIISYLALAVWFALGVSYCTSFARKVSAWLPAVLTLLVILSVCVTNFTDNNRRHLNWVENYGRSVLESLPPEAVFFAMDDFEVGVLGYLQKVMDVRPDVELRNWQNLVFDNRLASPFAPDAEQQSAMRSFMAENRKPVFASSVPIHPRELQGAYFRYTPTQPQSVVRNPQMDNFLDYLLDLYIGGHITDPHELHYASQRLGSFTRQHVGLALTHNDLGDAEMNRLQRLQSTFPGKMATMEVLIPLNNTQAKPMLTEIVTSAEIQMPEFAARESIGLLHEYHGRILMIEPADVTTAISYFEKSINAYPVPDNTSLCPLKILYGQHRLAEKLEKLTQRQPDISCD